MTEPIKDIIPREVDKDFQKALDFFADAIEEIVNFGSNILKWDLERSDGGDEILPGSLFLRNMIEEIDAISILIRYSAIDSCKALLRTIIENFFYLEFLCQKDSSNRSMSFLVWNTLNQISFLNKFNPSSEKAKEFITKCKNDRFLKNTQIKDIDGLEEFLRKNKDLLELKIYKETTQEYYNTKRKLKKNPMWYSLFGGPSNLEGLANVIGFPALYDIFYRSYSTSTHGNDIIQGRITISKTGKPQIFQIRYPEDAQSITQITYDISIATFFTFCKARLPKREQELHYWYKTFKQQFSDIGKININII